jgi:RNA polymerase sigma factor (sigma-70 family)
MTEEPIDHIVERVRAGEVDAYAEVIRSYQHVVWRIASFALQDVGATEDLVQQVFVNAYECLEQYQRGRDFGAWLRTIARNQVRKQLRQSSRDERKLRRYHAYLTARFEEDEAHAVEADQREESLREALQRCREQLSAPATEALSLRYEQAKGFDVIAKALGRTVAATRQLLSRTRLALRQCIEKRMAHAHE